MIKTQGLNYKNILKNINLNIDSSQTVSVLGPNGAGKSTLLKLLAGILTQDSGSLEVHQEKLSYVSQRPFISSGLTVKNLIEAYWYKKNKVLNQKLLDEVSETFFFFECEEFLSRKLDRLSGGELQKVILASAISTGPEILLLDESVSGLDPYQYEFVLFKIKDWQRKSQSLVLHVSHDINRSLLFSDEIVGISDGALLFHKKKEDVCIKDFESLFSIKLVESNKSGEPLQVSSGFLSELI